MPDEQTCALGSIDECLDDTRNWEGHVDAFAGRVFHLSKIVRLAKQAWTQQRPAAPPGSVTTLALIQEMGERASGCHAKELAARSGLDPSTVSRAVAAMVAQGLVERRADPHDGRATVLALTDAGEALLVEAQAWFHGVLGRALGGFDPEEVALLGRFLTALEAEFANNPDLEAAR
jgi:DNA-binding MarR family transcriptional regulator